MMAVTCGWYAKSDETGVLPPEAKGASATHSSYTLVASPSTPPCSCRILSRLASRAPPVCVPTAGVDAAALQPASADGTSVDRESMTK